MGEPKEIMAKFLSFGNERNRQKWLVKKGQNITKIDLARLLLKKVAKQENSKTKQ
jgi:hypothetical protein